MLNPSNRSNLTTLSKIALGLFWLALFIATHVPPASKSVVPENGRDKIAHYLGYAILATLVATTWQLAGGQLNRRHLTLAWLVIVVYGALDELTQIPVGRDCDIWDWTADAIGTATGLLLFVTLRRTLAKK